MKAGADVQVLVQHPLVRTVQTLAKKQGGTAYLVGGAVRDWLRTGQVPLDLDFTLIDCHAADLAKTLADERQGHLVPLDWEFGIHRVVFDDGMMVDLADALENDLQIDLARRDLTVNAIALDLETGSRIDPFKGQADLAAGVIRMVSEANLREDPLRLLRVFRFAALIQAQSIDPATLAVVEGHAGQVWEAAGERIQYEFFRFLSLDGCFPYLQMMADCGLLETLLPDLTPMRKIAGSGFHHLGLFEHTLELVKQAERLLPDLPTAVRDWLKQSMGGSYTRFGMVKLACLLHDIGKPDTMGEREDPVHGKRLTFYGHEELGAEMAKPLLQRLKVSNEIRDYQVKLIRWHLYPCQFGPGSPRKSVLKFYRRMGEETIDVTVLALADRHSATGAWITPEGIAEAHQAHLWLLENYQAEQPALQLPKLLNGHEVMSTLGVGPGPHLKEIMDALVEAQQLGEIKTPDEARSWLKAEFASSTS